MWILVASVFVAVFAGAAVLLWAARIGRPRGVRRTLERLEAVTRIVDSAPVEDAPIVRTEQPLSSIAWLDEWMRSFSVFRRLQLLLHQAQSAWTVGGFLAASLAAWVLAGALVFFRTGEFVPSLLVGAAAAPLPWLYLLQRRRRHMAVFEQLLPEALDLIVSALRAGHSLTSAIGVVGREMADPIGREFRQCFEEQNYGLDLRSALTNLAGRVPTQDVRIVVTACLVQKESGGNLAEVLEKVGVIIRERFRLKRQVQVHTAQARLTGWILCSLPFLLGVMLYVANPENMRLLWTRPLGQRMLTGAAVLMTTGVLVIRKIVRVRM